MPALENPRHEAFAQKLATGSEEITAYESLGKHRAKKRKSLHEAACRLARKVKARVKEIQAESKAATVMDIIERREICTEIARDKAIEPNHRIAATLAEARHAGELVEKVVATVDMSRVIPKDKRRELLAAAIARRTR